MAGTGLRTFEHRQSRNCILERRRAFESPFLHDRDELDVGGIELVAQEAIDVERLPRVQPMHAGQRVECHAGPAQQVGGGHHLVEGRRTALVDTKAVVQFTRPVDAQPDQKAVLFQEAGPVFVEQNAVGLKIVFDLLPGLRVFLLQGDHAAEEVQPAQGGLAALPREHDGSTGIAVDILADEKLQRLVIHRAGARPIRQRLFA